MSRVFQFSILMVWKVIKIETRFGFSIIYQVVMVAKFRSLIHIIKEGYAVAYIMYKIYSPLISNFSEQFKTAFENSADEVLPS